MSGWSGDLNFNDQLGRLRATHDWPGEGLSYLARCVGKNATSLGRYLKGRRKVDPTVTILMFAMERDPSLVEELMERHCAYVETKRPKSRATSLA